MKKYEIMITDNSVYINGKYQYFSTEMDKENKDDDLNKKALLALANEMGYEPQFLFEEMADRLEEMLDETDEESKKKIRYYVCGLGYDENNCITDYEQDFGDFDNYKEANELFAKLQDKNAESFFENMPEVSHLLIQLEECEEDDNEVTCIDVRDEFIVINPNFKSLKMEE